jgi:glyoxylase-like metal-dependent hydrolase (beta-lactamase superfamily II)
MILETVCVGSMQVNCYILASKENSGAIIIDPGDQARRIKEILDRHRLKPAFIVNTHGHYDHIGADDKFDVPVYIHSDDTAYLKDPQLNLSGVFAFSYQVKSETRTLKEGDVIKLDDLQLEVIHLPGHTPGGIALLMQEPTNKVVFTGDSLFCLGIGRSDLAGGDEPLLIKSIKEKLLILSGDTVIYPGHGPTSTIAAESENNPFLR